MRLNKFIILLSAIAILLIIPVWSGTDHEDRIHTEEYSGEGGVKKLEVDQILADDLSLTTSLFVSQLSIQLKQWADLDFTQPDIEKSFEQELSEHRHFNSFALLKNGEISISKGKIPQEHVNKLGSIKQEIAFSDPYTRNDQQYILMAHKKNDEETVIGEVDLSFVKRFVGEMGSVADANGNFIVSSGDTDVEWESAEQSDVGKVTQKVPELGWQIVVQSKPEEGDTEQSHYKEGEALVRFRTQDDMERWVANHPSYQVIKKSGPYVVLTHKNMRTDQLIERLSTEPEIETAEPNYLYNKQAIHLNEVRQVAQTSDASLPIPNDEFFEPYQWNLSQIQAEKGWQITGGSEDVIIAILDTGVDPNHQDLAGKLIEGYNTFDESNDAFDHHGHGTHVAGITGAITNNETGIAGVSWHNPIMPIKVLNENGEGSLFEITSGIRWATDHGAKVINMSLGDTESSQMLYDAIRYAYERDVVLVAASGNENVGTPMYPAGYEEVLAVAAVDDHQEKAVFSNYGEHIDVAAPGEHIPSTFPNNNYVFMSGTSMAAPHVTGLAGLIRSLRPELSNEEVMQLIRQTAEDLGSAGHDPYFGYGQINVAASLDYIQENEDSTLDHGEQNTVGETAESLLQMWLDNFKATFE
jgi:subtilisin family serine protease